MKLLWLAPLILTAGAGLTGTLWLQGDRPPAETRRGGAAGSRMVAANGIVEGARPEIALRPEIAGNIVHIPCRENDPVKAGDLLVELRNDAQKCQVDLARATLAEARADYQQCKAESERTHKLGAAVVSRERFDADHFKAQKAQAKLDEADARLRLAQAEFAKTRLTAPSGGRILRVYASRANKQGRQPPSRCCCSAMIPAAASAPSSTSWMPIAFARVKMPRWCATACASAFSGAGWRRSSRAWANVPCQPTRRKSTRTSILAKF